MYSGVVPFGDARVSWLHLGASKSMVFAVDSERVGIHALGSLWSIVSFMWAHVSGEAFAIFGWPRNL